jgi:hypothetical protein
MHESAERAIEALDEGHRARLTAVLAARLRKARDLLDEDAPAGRERIGSQGEDTTHFVRRRARRGRRTWRYRA